MVRIKQCVKPLTDSDSMKNVRLILAFGVLLAFAASCSRQPAHHDELQHVAFEEAPADFKITDNFSKFKFIQLEQTEDCVFEHITKMVDADGCIIVKTWQNDLFCFDKETGAFKCRIGRRGEGPGEYLHIRDFFYNAQEKSICVIDSYQASIISYDLSGNFLHKKKQETNISMISCAERTNDGYLMVANMVYDNPEMNNDAYTVIRPDGTWFYIDPFEPVWIKNSMSPFANKPMAKDKKGITFHKFLNDTIFRLEGGEVFPIYKLEIDKKMPTKEMVSQLGSYSQPDLDIWCLSTGYFTGLDRIFETEKLILLEPLTAATDGFFWIDKETNKGIRIPSSNRLDLVGKMVLEGKSIFKVHFSNEHELVCGMQAILVDCFKDVIEKNPELIPFSDELVPFLKNADSEGNPIVFIYEH